VIILVNRDVKIKLPPDRGLFTGYGLAEAIGILISRSFIHRLALSEFDAPASLQPWILQLTDSLTNPLLIFAVCCAVTGVALIVLSFFYHRNQSISPQAE
jgi:fucose permease